MENKQTAASQNSAEAANAASQLIDAKIAALAAIVDCNALGIAPRSRVNAARHQPCKRTISMFDLSQVALARVTDAHFACFLGEENSSLNLSQPPGGIDSPGMLRMLRGMVARLHQAGCQGHWLILDGSEVVGLCGYMRPPDAAKCVEIGYGIAPERRNKGYATKAIRLLLQEADADPAVEAVLAETSIDNLASKHVLQRNCFTRAGTREDAEDGILELWRFDLSPRHAGRTP